MSLPATRPTPAHATARGVVVAFATTAALSACVVAPAHRPVYQPAPPVVYQQPVPQAPQGVYSTAPPPVVVYQGPPPPPQQEIITVSPGPAFFWIPGVWVWEGNRHVWRGGRWEQRRPGLNYVPHRWERNGNAWHQHGGYWQR